MLHYLLSPFRVFDTIPKTIPRLVLSLGPIMERNPLETEKRSGTDSQCPRPKAAVAEEVGSTVSDVDHDLVRRFKQGDAEAFPLLLDRYQRSVFGMLRNMAPWGKETAEDLCQETFMRAFRGLPCFQGGSKFKTWLFRIATHVGITEIRKRRALKRSGRTWSIHGDEERGIPMMEPISHSPEPSEALSNSEELQRLRLAIDSIPPLWRSVLVLRDQEGKSYEEISEILGLPVGTVRSRLHRARSRVREALEQMGKGER
jgi:RNA polymerase sigma-70 factor (ECF subfamily)